MLRLLQWAYSLGVRNERQRIATYLTNAQGQRYNLPVYEAPIDSKKDASERQKRKAELKKAVDKEVIDIIEDLFRGKERYVRGESIMFPEGEGK